MITVGRLAVKVAGRDAGCRCVIVDILDNNFVLIDGETRRRKCNILHLELLPQTLEIKKGASASEVAHAMKDIGVESRTTKPKKAASKPAAKRKTPEELRSQKQSKKQPTAGASEPAPKDSAAKPAKKQAKKKDA